MMQRKMTQCCGLSVYLSREAI